LCVSVCTWGVVVVASVGLVGKGEMSDGSHHCPQWRYRAQWLLVEERVAAKGARCGASMFARRWWGARGIQRPAELRTKSRLGATVVGTARPAWLACLLPPRTLLRDVSLPPPGTAARKHTFAPPRSGLVVSVYGWTGTACHPPVHVSRSCCVHMQQSRMAHAGPSF